MKKSKKIEKIKKTSKRIAGKIKNKKCEGESLDYSSKLKTESAPFPS